MTTGFMSAKFHAIVALIIANIIWGATSPIMKYALADMHPFTLAFFRFSVATLILLPFAYKSLKVERKDIKDMVLMAFFGVTLSIGLFFLGLTYTESINAPLIGSAGPIFVLIISVLFMGEKLKMRSAIGGLLGLLGVLAILLEPLLEKGLDGSVVGNLILVGSSLAGIVHLFISKKLTTKYSPITITFYSFWLGSVSFLIPFGKEVITNGIPVFSTPSIIGILYGALFASVIAHYLFYGAEKYLHTTEVALFSYVPPVVAVLIAVPLLGEHVTPLYLLGGLLVFAGIFISEAHKHAHPFHHHR